MRPVPWTDTGPDNPLISSLLAGLEITPNDLGHIGILGLFDEGGIVDPLVVEFNILLLFVNVARRLLLALRFRVGILRRGEIRASPGF